MDDRVDVGYDTSPESAAAVRWAATQAAGRGWALDVVHVWGFAGRDGGGAGESWLGREVQSQVRAVAEEGAVLAAEAAPGVDARPVVLHGPPARVLVDRAEDARLVVVGRRGAGLVAALVGSVATGVLHRARCPVAVVPAAARPGSAREPVLVGFDGSAGAFRALEAGCEQAAHLGTGVVVVTAWTAAAEASRAAYWALGYPSRSPAEVALDEAERVLERARSWAASRRDVEVAFDLAEGRPAQALVRRSRHAGLLVVGTRGRGGLAGLVLGSTSRPVVQRAECPVLVTRGPEAVPEPRAPRPARAAATA
ncbi:universal stress protein [Cellulomonas pakistanensis]|uniref:Universal stress protein n=1 Tax=Cellulomonas pakistanensis TaxID=992287 RepID=A0A919P9C9_9CELL|nr:universal stress protein [Cellulomonas pakistanensis]GIG36794.1 universal stress protein [Cellulomonas pakistanensis]